MRAACANSDSRVGANHERAAQQRKVSPLQQPDGPPKHLQHPPCVPCGSRGLPGVACLVSPILALRRPLSAVVVSPVLVARRLRRALRSAPLVTNTTIKSN